MTTDISSKPTKPPVRLCCGQRHYGPVCPDNTVMCCVCFDKFTIDQLSTDPESGKKQDVCLKCYPLTVG